MTVEAGIPRTLQSNNNYNHNRATSIGTSSNSRPNTGNSIPPLLDFGGFRSESNAAGSAQSNLKRKTSFNQPTIETASKKKKGTRDIFLCIFL